MIYEKVFTLVAHCRLGSCRCSLSTLGHGRSAPSLAYMVCVEGLPGAQQLTRNVMLRAKEQRKIKRKNGTECVAHVNVHKRGLTAVGKQYSNIAKKRKVNGLMANRVLTVPGCHTPFPKTDACIEVVLGLS